MPMQQKSAQGFYSWPGPSKHDPCVEERPPNSQLLSGATPNQILEPRFHPMEYLALVIGNQCPCSKSWLKARIAGQGPANMTHVWRQNLQTANFSLMPHKVPTIQPLWEMPTTQPLWEMPTQALSQRPIWLHRQSMETHLVHMLVCLHNYTRQNAPQMPPPIYIGNLLESRIERGNHICFQKVTGEGSATLQPEETPVMGRICIKAVS